MTQSGRRDGVAIASAINDAIGILGAVTELPVTLQRLKRLLSRARTISRA
jgi:hypothetical protein